MIEPTIGRVVWYTPNDIDKERVACNGQKHAALVTHVWNNRMVNLAIYDSNGCAYNRTSVPLKQEGDYIDASESGYCEWMPYQKGQAARAEALERGNDSFERNHALLTKAKELMDELKKL